VLAIDCECQTEEEEKMSAQALKIDSLLAPSDVVVDLRVADKMALLRELSQRAGRRAQVPADAIFAELSRREELGSTGIGGGVAIPHTRVAGIAKPFAIAARVKPAINFDAIDGRLVDLAFLLLLPPDSTTDNLNALAAISRKLRDRDVVAKLRSSSDAAQFFNVLTAA
jgi:PTS system nitrogen regulatory IIA component